MDFAITHRSTPQGGEFVATVPGENATGELTWRAGEGTMIAEHTLVPSALGGRGIAAALVEALVAHARAHGLRVVPQCSYVAAAFKRRPEWADVKG